MIFNNEGQESAVLLGNPAFAAKRIPGTLQVAGSDGVIRLTSTFLKTTLAMCGSSGSNTKSKCVASLRNSTSFRPAYLP